MSAFKDWLNSLTSKTTPVDADELYVRDSSGTPGSKKLTWANLKATLANTFLSLTGGTVAGGTRTTSGSTLTITETLNNAGVTFPGALVIDQTRTAADNKSLIADFKVGGSSKMRVLKDGGIALGSTSNPPDYGGINYSTDGIGGFLLGAYGGYGIHMGSGCVVGWGASGPGEKDLILVRDAAGTLAQRNGTNAQTHRWYGTYTDASNYRRVALAMTTAGVASITPEGAGTGASGNVLHISGLPTSNPGAGILWNDSGTVKVGT
jgi:hypothetical protein